MTHSEFISQLLDLKQLNNSKLIVALTTILTISLGLVYLSNTKPKWRASAEIQIARVRDNESSAYYPKTVEEILSSLSNVAFLLNALEKTSLSSTEKEILLNSTYFAKKNENNIVMQTKVSDIRSAKIFLDEIIAQLKKEEELNFNSKINHLKTEINILTNSNNAIGALLKKIPVTKEGIPYLSALSLIQLDNAGKISKLQDILSPEITFQTRVNGPIIISKRPIFPSKKVIVVFSILMGFINGYFIAFACNSFISKSSNKSKI